MLTVKNLIPVLDEFMIGDINSHVILPPETVALDDILNARVASITSKDNTPVVWIHLGGYDEDYLDFT